ncbi:MAG: sulfite exporter TauE/SafE family protein [Saprospiraceae bacterium]|nr:sulfite exporter TauE/SafE family protein [Saprospiraceae bacterium]
MEIIIAFVAFAASLLTLFSGFGLGTILTPAFGIFFPLNIAVALTGVVHLLNNFFKLALLGKNASKDLLLRFGIPSVVGGFLGALSLAALASLPVLFTWQWDETVFSVTLLKLSIGILMIFFSLMEILPGLKNLEFSRRYLTMGGLLSGFFGGLSGHQGALRSAFLVKYGLNKEVFIATGVAIACMVDLTRLPVYFARFSAMDIAAQWQLLLIATFSAFAGAYLGARFLKKTTMPMIQKITAAMIVLIAVLLSAGIL